MIPKEAVPDFRLPADWMARITCQFLVFGHVLAHVIGTMVTEQGKFIPCVCWYIYMFVRSFVCSSSRLRSFESTRPPSHNSTGLPLGAITLQLLLTHDL